jgi:hypothetical protein
MFSNEGLGVQGRIGGQQKGKVRAGERLGGGGIANTHTHRKYSSSEEILLSLLSSVNQELNVTKI